MNAPGKAYTFVTPEEGDELTAVEILCNTLLKKDEIPDFDNGVKRRPRKRR
jgi:superfamily II DNA/RNA helicase